jgi:hypothetical protein
MSDAQVKTAYENNADTNAFTDSEQTNLGNQSGTNTGDQDVDATIVAGGNEASEDLAFLGTDINFPNLDESDTNQPLTIARGAVKYNPQHISLVSIIDSDETLYGGATSNTKDYRGWKTNIDDTVGKEGTLLFAENFAAREGTGQSTRFDVYKTEVGWRMGRMFQPGVVMRLNIGVDSTTNGELSLSHFGIQVEIRNDATNGWQARMNATDGSTLELGTWTDFTSDPDFNKINYFKVTTEASGNLILTASYDQNTTFDEVLNIAIPAIVLGSYGFGHVYAMLDIENYAQSSDTFLGKISNIFYKY